MIVHEVYSTLPSITLKLFTLEYYLKAYVKLNLVFAFVLVQSNSH
jgi:hypothetical protein